MTRFVKWLGLALVVLGGAAFVFFSEARKEFEVFSERFGSLGEHQVRVPVRAEQNYRLEAWASDEEGGLQQWAEVTGNLTVRNEDGEQLFSDSFSANSSSGNESSGIQRAQNGTTFRHTASRDETLTAIVELTAGDAAELTVFEGGDEATHMAPGLSIIASIVGLVLFLRSRAALARRSA